MKNPPTGTTVDTTNIHPGELVHMEFTLYNVTAKNRNLGYGEHGD